MNPIVLYIHAENWEDPLSRFRVKCKEVKKHFVWHLIPYNLGLKIFQKNTLNQTMDHIVLYIHAKIGKILGAV